MEVENWASGPRAITWDETLAFEAPLLSEAYKTWRVAAEGAIPPRSRITARLAKAFVGNLMIFERQSPGVYLIRLMGSRITHVLGEMQGKLLSETLPAVASERWTMALNNVLASRKPLRVVTVVNINEMQFLEAEIFLAPLCDDQGQETMVFAVVFFRSGVAKSRSIDDLVVKN
ncbi:MAG: PAS domain-containing protein [Rhizomicrobium sp.]|nr:PAS domain-containing protein [Rhizomicrobium sp.]